MEKRSWIRGNLIGSGSFGSVSLANDKSTGRIFAVKSVNPTSSSPLSILSLENEIEILKKVNSPHIVSYFGDDTTKEANLVMRRNLHMEFVPGGTVAELAVKKRGLEERELRGYARCLTHALHYLHLVAGIVHCDVKGQNLLVGSGPDGAKLSDFGSAKYLADVEKGVNFIGGTPYWMAPEVARGEAPSPASDVWSLGCTVLEMTTGSHPWAELGLGNTDVAGLLVRIGYGGILPKYPANMSNDATDFLDKCLKFSPINRWDCEKLLRHPFLADVAETDSTGPSPRGVLDWDSEEFGDENEENEYEFGDLEEELFGSAMERVSALCSEEESLEWDSDGWETVRWGLEVSAKQVGIGCVGRKEGISVAVTVTAAGVFIVTVAAASAVAKVVWLAQLGPWFVARFY
ncbi:Mitogen-activated protein kinase kinase kinase 3 [Rhynchospora pubera]|uniref:Mitogen-activated protein kinase kinase kinase 3 n=1 Tax=Rhynchospora pubera TaxID=906938 RepID=A0AAV8FNC3_9POAL|nr:Mitogen-activated protein kinase kinase kinase 3 [Rhynchospora pubera]